MKKIIISIFLLMCFICSPIGIASKVVNANEYTCVNLYAFDNLHNINFTSRISKYITKDVKTNICKLKSMGFDDNTILNYLFVDYKNNITNFLDKINSTPVNSTIDVSCGRAQITKSLAGFSADANALEKDIVNGFLTNDKINVKFIKQEPTITENDLINLTNLKSSFNSPIYGVNQQGRIANISLALSKFNNMCVLPNQTVSFNSVIGETNQQNGYSLAKVILNGKYIEDFGGGVCQASTCLYNALIMAGLEIVSSAPHSLKVGYCKGAFDAMVSYGISDLVFKNNTDMPIYIYTYCDGNNCGVKIFGEKNKYNIVERSEKQELSDEQLKNYDSKYIGYLDYYKDDNLIKTEKIREVLYKKVVPKEHTN